MGRNLERRLALDQANEVLKLYSLKLIRSKGIWYVVRPETENLMGKNTAYMPVTHRHIVLIAPDEPRRKLVDRVAHVIKHSDEYSKRLELHALALWGLEVVKNK